MKYNLLALVITGLLASGCNNAPQPETEQPATQESAASSYNPYSKSEITHEIFRVDSVDNSGVRGWGYNILVDGKIYIHQPTVPAVMGNNGFSSEEKAQKAAGLVISKIRNNVIPPSVTPEELDSLEVLD
jgi:hypothetical protein